MTTKISYRASGNMTSAASPHRVKETVAEVIHQLSVAKAQQTQFIVATDADSGKEISVKTALIDDIAEE